MKKETKNRVKVCVIIAAILLYLDLFLTIIGVGLFSLSEYNTYSLILINYLTFPVWVLFYAIIILPFVIFLYVLMFPLLSNVFIPKKFKHKEKIIKFFLYVGTILVAWVQIPVIINNIFSIFTTFS